MQSNRFKIAVTALLIMALQTIGGMLTASAQMLNPVHFSAQMEEKSGGEAEIVFKATIDEGWHVYSTNLGGGGPIEASFHADKMQGAEPVGKLEARGNEKEQFDEMFGMTVRFFEKSVSFVQRIRFTAEKYDIDCYLEYGACNDQSCLPPSHATFNQTGTATLASKKVEKLSDKASAKEDAAKEDVAAEQEMDSTAATEVLQTTDETAVVAQFEMQDSQSSMSLWMIFLEGLLGGFLALLTPCVWPIIPMTVSFFLKRNKDRRKAVGEAVAYGLAIVVIYVTLGLAVTLLFGASALNAMATNAVFNIFFALLLVVFAASFFGAFEIALPASWANRVDDRAGKTTGLVSIFLMAFTLALVSFSCTGPIIGFLLVAVSTQGSIIAPTVGMLGFAIALALPFTVFALFPSMLKSAPRSGQWMNVIKVTLGFIELAFALKFLSVADLAYGWHLLDREVFLAIWIVLFTLLGLYLLGVYSFAHDDKNRTTNVTQFFMALASLAFAVYMLPGLWGAPLKAISAFTPPMSTQDFRLQKTLTEARFQDYDAGLAAARAEGKPMLIDFTGYGCVNCRKMEAAVWTDERVSQMLNNDFVLVSLYVDDKTPLKEPIIVTENGTERKLRTVGDRWSYLQRTQFGANAQPFYVIVDADGHTLTAPRGYDEDVDEYIGWLKSGKK